MKASQLIKNLSILIAGLGDVVVYISIESMEPKVWVTGRGSILNINADLVSTDGESIIISHNTDIKP